MSLTFSVGQVRGSVDHEDARATVPHQSVDHKEVLISVTCINIGFQVNPLRNVNLRGRTWNGYDLTSHLQNFVSCSSHITKHKLQS